MQAACIDVYHKIHAMTELVADDGRIRRYCMGDKAVVLTPEDSSAIEVEDDGSQVRAVGERERPSPSLQY